MNKFRQELISLFELKEDSPLWHKRIDKGIYLLILLSSFGVILETILTIKQNLTLLNTLLIFEDIAMTIFVIELMLRLSVIKELYAHCKTGWERFMFIFYILIDFMAILPAVLFAIGSQHHDYFLTLRLLRVFKVFRHDDSVELVLRAILIKKDILFKTAIIILITTVFLSVLLYEAENKFEFGFNKANPNLLAQSEDVVLEAAELTQFTDIWASMVWCFSMFVGDLAGYIESGFMPTTPIGRFVAGILGFLNIAIVVIPTGIIASGFLEVLEVKKVASQHIILEEAFRPKYNPILGIKVYERPRTMFTLQNALYIHQNNLFKILETRPGFRLRSVQSDANEKYGDLNLVEYFGYGTLTTYGVQRAVPEAKATIICPEAFAQKGIGYFSYAISELHQSNLISNELFQSNSLNKAFDTSFLINEHYHQDFELPTSKRALKNTALDIQGIYHFKKDIQTLSAGKPCLVFMAENQDEDYKIEKIEGDLGQANDLLQWLTHQKIESYLITINTRKLDEYSFYELIKEVDENLKRNNI